MSSAEQWAGALRKPAGQPFTLHFDRLGLTASCRPLLSGEVEECRRMGGERGLRYALYLSCEELRKAGEQLRMSGELASPFDITERLGYGDASAAGAAVLQQSSIRAGGVSLEGTAVVSEQEELPEEPEALFPDSGTERSALFGEKEAESCFSGEYLARDLADRLRMAAGNR